MTQEVDISIECFEHSIEHEKDFLCCLKLQKRQFGYAKSMLLNLRSKHEMTIYIGAGWVSAIPKDKKYACLIKFIEIKPKSIYERVV